MVILGVTMNEALSFEAHITRISCQARQSLYALRILVAHGLSGPMLYDVVRATTVTLMLYAAPAWWGFAGQQEKNRLQSAMWRLIRLQYLPEDSPSVEHLCHTPDSRLFSAVLGNPGHVLHGLLPLKTRSPTPYARNYMVVLFHKRTISHADRL